MQSIMQMSSYIGLPLGLQLYFDFQKFWGRPTGVPISHAILSIEIILTCRPNFTHMIIAKDMCRKIINGLIKYSSESMSVTGSDSRHHWHWPLGLSSRLLSVSRTLLIRRGPPLSASVSHDEWLASTLKPSISNESDAESISYRPNKQKNKTSRRKQQLDYSRRQQPDNCQTSERDSCEGKSADMFNLRKRQLNLWASR